MSIAQSSTIVKPELYQPNTDRAAILELADASLAQAQKFREKWLAGGDPQSWQLWRACLADREALLGEVGRS